MTNKNEMPGSIWLWRNTYDEVCISGRVDENCLDNYHPSHTKYIRADLVKERSDEPHQQPVHSTQGTDFHRCNVEKTETGFRLCDGLHDKNEPCEWVLYEPKAQPVDLDALKAEVCHQVCNGPDNECSHCITACDTIDYLANRGLIRSDYAVSQDAFDQIVEMLDREPQYKPRLADLLRGGGQPTEDAQRALDDLKKIEGKTYFCSEIANEDYAQWVNTHVETIRAALARGLGE